MESSSQTHATAIAPRFGVALQVGLLLPAILAICSWLGQFFGHFPPRSRGVSLTALGLATGAAGELIPFVIAIVQVVRAPVLRTYRSFALIAFGSIVIVPTILVLLLLMLRR